jgi:hypothetical protein
MWGRVVDKAPWSVHKGEAGPLASGRSDGGGGTNCQRLARGACLATGACLAAGARMGALRRLCARPLGGLDGRHFGVTWHDFI